VALGVDRRHLPVVRDARIKWQAWRIYGSLGRDGAGPSAEDLVCEVGIGCQIDLVLDGIGTLDQLNTSGWEAVPVGARSWGALVQSLTSLRTADQGPELLLLETGRTRQ